MFKNSYSHHFHSFDDTRIFFQTNFPLESFEKEKPLLVFNYGLVCNNEHWREQIVPFDELGHQILIHDFRAHYGSSGADNIDGVTFKNISQDIHGVIEQIGARDVFMLGHSMGVNITLEYARMFPENLMGIIIISGTVLPPQDIMFDTNVMDLATPFLKQLPEIIPRNIFDTIWKNSYMNPVIRKFIHNGGFNTEKVSDEFVQIYLKRVGELTPELFFHLLEQMREHDILLDLEKIEVPALVMGRDKDKVIPNYYQKVLKDSLPKSEYYVIKDGSHVPQADFPESVNERIKLFIEKWQL